MSVCRMTCELLFVAVQHTSIVRLMNHQKSSLTSRPPVYAHIAARSTLRLLSHQISGWDGWRQLKCQYSINLLGWIMRVARLYIACACWVCCLFFFSNRNLQNVGWHLQQFWDQVLDATAVCSKVQNQQGYSLVSITPSFINTVMGSVSNEISKQNVGICWDTIMKPSDPCAISTYKYFSFPWSAK
jgi:hypothetical protein